MHKRRIRPVKIQNSPCALTQLDLVKTCMHNNDRKNAYELPRVQLWVVLHERRYGAIRHPRRDDAELIGENFIRDTVERKDVAVFELLPI